MFIDSVLGKRKIHETTPEPNDIPTKEIKEDDSMEIIEPAIATPEEIQMRIVFDTCAQSYNKLEQSYHSALHINIFAKGAKDCADVFYRRALRLYNGTIRTIPEARQLLQKAEEWINEAKLDIERFPNVRDFDFSDINTTFEMLSLINSELLDQTRISIFENLCKQYTNSFKKIEEIQNATLTIDKLYHLDSSIKDFDKYLKELSEQVDSKETTIHGFR